MGPGVVVDHDAGAEDPVGVGEQLDPPHHLGRLGSPLALDERRHVHAGPVLGLQRAVVAIDDQRDQPLHEGVVALEVLGLGEVRREHEVQVPRRRVAGDARQEAVLGEQRLQVLRHVRHALRAHAHVLDDQRRARARASCRPGRACPRARSSTSRRSRRRGESPARGSGRARRAPRRRAPRPRRARPRCSRRTRPAARPRTGRARASSPGCRGCCARRRSAPEPPSARRRAPRRRRSPAPARAPRRRWGSAARRRSSSRGWRTVSKTASAMNASVPSEPTSSRRKISSGVSASRNAHSR